MKNKAIILGSGPTGLITAWKLLEKGWKDLWASVEEMVIEDVLPKIKIVNNKFVTETLVTHKKSSIDVIKREVSTT